MMVNSPMDASKKPLFENQLLTVDDVAIVLRCSKKQVYRLIQTADIPYKMIGRQYRFLFPQLMNWIEQGD